MERGESRGDWSFRSKFVLFLIFLMILATLLRTSYLQVFNQEFLSKQGQARFSRTVKIPAQRGNILDRNGQLLASSAPTLSVSASPSTMIQPDQQKLENLSKILRIDLNEIERKISNKKRDFVYLKRQISPDEAEKVRKLNIRGVSLLEEAKRFYPRSESTAHTVGTVSIDNQGQSGMELSKNKMLSGSDGERHYIRDRKGAIIENIEITPAINGQDISLALDSRIQYVTYRELNKTVEKFKARSGSIVVLDAKTGEVLALANVPTFNPNNRSEATLNNMRNRAVSDALEPGSMLKPFTTALALDKGLITPSTVIDLSPITFGETQVKDPGNYSALDVSGIIQKSSNVGASKISLMMSPHEVWSFYDALGFGRKPQTGISGETTGKLRSWKTWRPIEQASMSFGYGISVSLIQLARAYTIFTKDGELLPISFIKLDTQLPGKRIIKPETARALRRMLFKVTQPGGTATRAQIQGYSVGGKTGTARVLVDGEYSPDRHIASFIGFAPVENPKLIVAVSINEPQSDFYGGIVAAPLFSRVMSSALRILHVNPDIPH